MSRRAILPVAALCLLAGCQAEPIPNSTAPSADAYHSGDVITPRIWVDAETGCQYLMVRVKEGYAVSPRLGRGGLPMCSPKQEQG